MSGICMKYYAQNQDTGEEVSVISTNSEDAYLDLLNKLGYHVYVEED